MVDIYIDTEFNGFGGKLLSMGIVVTDHNYFIGESKEWYEVLDYSDIFHEMDPWVNDNVLPMLLERPGLSYDAFRTSFISFIQDFEGATVHVDWPSDVVHLTQLLLGRNHTETFHIPFTIKVHDFASNYGIVSEVPHHALHDARMIRKIVEYQKLMARFD